MDMKRTSAGIDGSTKFTSDAGVMVATRSELKSLPPSLYSATRVGYDQSSIYDFLAKPLLITTFQWNAGTTGELAYVTLPEIPFAVDMLESKLKGFLGFKGTAIVRVQVNGNRFQSGRLLCTFIPQAQVSGMMPKMRTRSLKALTQLPRVELDLANDTEVIMEVPYISPTPFYNLVTGEGPMGRFYVHVYCPLRAGTGVTHADVSIFVSFKDVELTAPAYTQSSRASPSRKNPTEAELEATGEKPISSGLSKMASAAQDFSKIPMLSSVAGPASWALTAMSGVAAAFGYSKPSSETPITKVQNFNNFNSMNANGVDPYPVFGLDAGNKMSVLPGFAGTDVDEMCLSHLLSTPSYATAFEWRTDQAADTSLLTSYVHPHMWTETGSSGSWPWIDYTPLGYFSSFFFYWRGSIVVTLKVVKTNFHSGRLVVSYNPAGVATHNGTNQYLFRHVLDIRETNEFKIVIPYISTKQYRNTQRFSSSVDDHTGLLDVRILNELVCPDTVPQTLVVLVEVAGGDDFEVALAANYNAMPLVLDEWAAQSSSAEPNRVPAPVALREPIGASTLEDADLGPSMYCIGEKVNSILQLLKRYSAVNFANNDTGHDSVDIRPFTVGAPNSSSAVTPPGFLTSDYLTMLSPCFTYSRGSVRVVAVPYMGDPYQAGSNPVSVYPSLLTNPILYNVNAYFQPGMAINWQPANGATVVGATIPPFQQLHSRLNRLISGVLAPTVDAYESPMRVNFFTGNKLEQHAFRLYRAVGDDFTLGYFIGVPLVTPYQF